MDSIPKLRELGLGVRLGVIALSLVLLGGLAASATHLLWHYENRDERPGLSMDDLRGAYHGVERLAPLLTALQRGHPEELAESDRATLLTWLESDRVSEDYDNLDLGDSAPAEIIARSCLECHSRQATTGDIGKTIPLDYFDDIRDRAFSRQIQPSSIEVMAASTHAHALSLATMSIVVAALALMTSWPGRVIRIAIALMSIALLADMGSWWLARQNVAFVWLVVVGGGLYNGMTALLIVSVGVDCLFGKARTSRGAEARAAE